MSPKSKREYVEAVFLRYKNASRSEKSAILDEFCANRNYHRKHAIRVLRKFKRFVKPKQKKRGRTPVYNKEAIAKPLKLIWKASNLPCSKCLKVILPLWLPGYVKNFGHLPDDVSKALVAVSPATIDRLLKPVKAKYKLHGRATTKPGTLLRNPDTLVLRPGNLSLGNVEKYSLPAYRLIFNSHPLDTVNGTNMGHAASRADRQAFFHLFHYKPYPVFLFIYNLRNLNVWNVQKLCDSI